MQVKPATKRAPLEERKQLKRRKELPQQDNKQIKKPRQDASYISITDPLRILRTVALGNLSDFSLKCAVKKASAAGEVRLVC